MDPSTLRAGPDLEGIVRTHQTGLWRYLRFLGCEPDLAEDLVQETFLALLQKPFEERGPASTAAFLRRVAKNLYLMRLRKATRAPVVEDIERADQSWRPVAGDDDGESYVAALRDCYERLGQRARRALDLRFRDGRDRRSIAAALGLGEDGIKSLMRRSRAALRDCVRRKIRD